MADRGQIIPPVEDDRCDLCRRSGFPTACTPDGCINDKLPETDDVVELGWRALRARLVEQTSPYTGMALDRLLTTERRRASQQADRMLRVGLTVGFLGGLASAAAAAFACAL